LALLAQPLPPMESVPDTLLVAGGPGVDRAAADAVLINWLRDRAGRVRRVGSVCSGAFLLAEAGVLDGRRAVTHWSVCADLARRFPAVRVEADPIFVCDGPVWTSAGVTAGIDLALALVQEDLGRSVALAVARYLVVFLKRPGGQAQFSVALALQMAGGPLRFPSRLDGGAFDRRPLTPGFSPRGRVERTKLQPPLCGSNRSDAGARGRATQGRRGAAHAFRLSIARETDCATVWLRVRGNDAAQLPPPTVHHTAGLSRALQLLGGKRVGRAYLARGRATAPSASRPAPPHTDPAGVAPKPVTAWNQPEGLSWWIAAGLLPGIAN
jgi:hypothetical protein